MSARKAYISSLGTTGLLVAAALSMLIVVGALVAFDRWPSQAVAEAEAVPIAGDRATVSHRAGEIRPLGRDERGSRTPAVFEKRSRAVLRAAAARAGRFEHSSHQTAPAPAVSQPVISDLPAPSAEPDAPAAPAPAQQAPAAQSPAPAPAPQTPDATPPAIALPPGSLAPTAEDSLADATSDLGETVGGLSPALGETVSSTGTTATGTIETLVGGQ